MHFGHGSYNKYEDTGFLLIGGERTKIWDLKPSVMPPIVLLAACESAVLAETHNTPANAFLILGARTVLATYFPVQADLTAILYRRIIVNLFEAIKGRDDMRTWQGVVSKTLMLNRYLDYVIQFSGWLKRKRRAQIPAEFFREYTYRWNSSGFKNMAEGYKRCPELIQEALAHFSKDIAQDFNDYVRNTQPVQHTMFFSQLGSPETILLHKAESRAPEPADVRNYWDKRKKEDGVQKTF